MLEETKGDHQTTPVHLKKNNCYCFCCYLIKRYRSYSSASDPLLFTKPYIYLNKRGKKERKKVG
jgi:hypothetical protein